MVPAGVSSDRPVDLPYVNPHAVWRPKSFWSRQGELIRTNSRILISGVLSFHVSREASGQDGCRFRTIARR